MNNKLSVLVFLAPGFEEVEALTPVDYLRRAGIEVCTAALDCMRRLKEPRVHTQEPAVRGSFRALEKGMYPRTIEPEVRGSKTNTLPKQPTPSLQGGVVDFGTVGKTVVSGSHDIPVMADAPLSALAAEGKLVPARWDAVILPGGLPGAPNLAASEEVGAFVKAMAKADKWVCAICAAPALVLAPLGLLEGRKFTCFPGLEKKVSAASWTEDRVVVDKNPLAGGIITSRGAGTAGEFAFSIIAYLLGETSARELAEKVLLRRD